MKKEKKINRCKFSHYHLDGTYACVQAGWGDDQIVPTDAKKCGKCKLFKSRYIEYPITVSKITTEKIEYNKDSYNGEIGMLVAVRPCGDKKTYVGFFIGNMPVGISISHNRDTGVLKADTYNNPAIFVPELNKIIFGCNSWWYRIESKDQLREISDDDINNTWYVKLAKKLSESN